MCRCNLWLVFLLRLTLCSNNKAAETRKQLLKTIRKDVDLTPVCSNSTQTPIFTVCRIRPLRSEEEECLISYRVKTGFEQGCDPRFSLAFINETLFLQLNNLTAENSGNYTCQCVEHEGTFTLQLNITVEDDENTTPRPADRTPDTFLISVIGVSVLMVFLLGVVAGFIWRNRCNRRRRCELVTTATQNTLPQTEVPDIDPYSVFKENELYLTSIIHTSSSTNNLISVGTDNRSLGRPF